MSIWTPAREAQLIVLWNAGSSAALIAWQFDTTPNAVIGKVHRLRKAGVDMRTDAPTKNPSPGQRASRFGATAKRVPRKSNQSAQDPSLSAPDKGGPHSVDPRTAHPPAQKTVQTVSQLPPGQPAKLIACAAPGGPFIPGECTPSSDAAAKSPVSRQLADHPPTPVTLDALRANQCHFPIWPHMALPSHRLYGVMCGGPVAPDPNDSARHAPRYCAHHLALCTRPKREVV